MPKIYLVAHAAAYRAFEDFCLGMVSVGDKINANIKVITYCNEKDIPDSDEERETKYFFMSFIPPKFYRKHMIKEHPHIYLINTEQTTRKVWSTMLSHYAKHGIKLFDYDLWQAKKLNTLWLPYPISDKEDQSLSKLIAESPKYYNVAICSINGSKRRANIYNKLQQMGLKVIDVCGWKAERDQKIAQSQILINIHYDADYQVFEHFRCARWILAGMLTVSETSHSDDLLDYKDLVTTEPYPKIVNKIVEILANYDQYFTNYLEKLFLIKNKIIKERIKTLGNNIHGERPLP